MRKIKRTGGVNMKHITKKIGTAAGKDFTIDVSQDTTTWETVATLIDGGG